MEQRWGQWSQFTLETATKRFREKMRPHENGCILWTGAVDSKDGYGQLMINKRYWRAHRAAVFLLKGIDPGTSCVCHTCDNPLCVNTDHLFLGSNIDNIRDMDSKNRRARGERHWKAKLDVASVREIRRRHSEGVIPYDLRDAYNVSLATIYRVINHVGWIDAE